MYAGLNLCVAFFSDGLVIRVKKDPNSISGRTYSHISQKHLDNPVTEHIVHLGCRL